MTARFLSPLSMYSREKDCAVIDRAYSSGSRFSSDRRILLLRSGCLNQAISQVWMMPTRISLRGCKGFLTDLAAVNRDDSTGNGSQREAMGNDDGSPAMQGCCE